MKKKLKAALVQATDIKMEVTPGNNISIKTLMDALLEKGYAMPLEAITFILNEKQQEAMEAMKEKDYTALAELIIVNRGFYFGAQCGLL